MRDQVTDQPDPGRNPHRKEPLMKYRSKENGNLTDADKKFFTLRESGYTGPIDQDGNKVESGRAVEILKALRDKT